MRTTWLALVLLAAAACTREPTTAAEDQAFNGTWHWVSSTGGIAAQQRTPASEGYTVRLEYDGAKGRVRAFRNEVLVATVRYSARELPTMGPLPVWEVVYDPPLEVFRFDALDRHTVHLHGKRLIELVDPCCDRWVHTLTDPTLR